MSKTLTEIAHELKCTDKKVQLVYAFNGTGKTRLSQEFIGLVTTPTTSVTAAELQEAPHNVILYYNAYTEDLFYWNRDSLMDVEPKLRVHPNRFTDWLLRNQGQDFNIASNFQRYVGQNLTPRFSKDFSEVTFTLERGDNEGSGSLKISKGEESNFIWSIFYTLLEQVVNTLNIADPDQRETRQFDDLKYVFIDDPVSSLDENHLIELAVDLADLIKGSEPGLQFIITTHNPLFYNVLFNEINTKDCYMLHRLEDGLYGLTPKGGGSNRSFSYHLHLRQTIEQAIASNQVERVHFTLLRNLYEKTASFLGYEKWSDLLPDDRRTYMRRILHFSSHSSLSAETVAEPTPQEKQTVKYLLDDLITRFGFSQSHGG